MRHTQPVHQTDAPSYFFAGTKMTVHLSGEQTGGQFCVLENTIPPGYMTPPHVHDSEDEAFLVLDGALDLVLGADRITVGTGQSAFAPRGIPHQLQNTSGKPVRVIAISTPPGFGEFVRAAGEPADAGPPPAVQPEKLMATAARFGIRLAA